MSATSGLVANASSKQYTTLSAGLSTAGVGCADALCRHTTMWTVGSIKRRLAKWRRPMLPRPTTNALTGHAQANLWPSSCPRSPQV